MPVSDNNGPVGKAGSGRKTASLRSRVLGIAAVALVAASALIGWSGTVVLDVRAAVAAQRTVLVPAVETVADYDVAVREQVRGERGYILTGDATYLKPYEVGTDDGDAALAQLDRLFASDPEGAELLRVTEQAHHVWLRDATEPAIEATRAGRRDEAVAIVATEGGARFDTFLTALGSLEDHVHQRLVASEDALQRSEQRLLRLLVGAALAAVVIVGLVIAALARWVTGPVRRLSVAVRAVAAGNLTDSLIVSGPREVVELAEDVDDMRQRLLAEFDEMRRANEALEQEAPLVVGLRDVLEPTIDAPDGVAVASLQLPAEGLLAGDWYGVWRMGERSLAMAVIDISGHGADAGLFALRVKDLVVSSLAVTAAPGAALGWVAQRLGDTGEQFATIFLAVVDIEDRVIRYASAGHPVVLVASAVSIVSILPTGPLLGPFQAHWSTERAELPDGATVLAYTDGLLEARRDGEEFGSGRLLEIVTRLRGVAPDALVEGCRAALDAFAPGQRADDITLLAVSPLA